MKRSIIGLLSLLVYAPWIAAFFPVDEPVLATYQFTLDGKSITPPVWSLHGTPETPRQGDVVMIGDLLITLGPEMQYDFRSTPDEDGRLLLRTEKSGRELVAGVKVTYSYQGDRRVVFNPLPSLTHAELRGLRGVSIGEWNDEVAARLQRIDPERTCVTISGETGQEPAGTLPPLPPGLFYLKLDASSGNRVTDISRLKRQSALRFLIIEGVCGHVDAGDLQQAAQLAYLDLSGIEIQHTDALASLTELRHLDLAYCETLNTLAFASGLRRLVELGVQGTAIEDFTPLGGLASLATLVANRTPARLLPHGHLPALRRLEVMATQLPDHEVAEFRAAHPNCQVWFRWDRVLRDALEGATHVRVRSDGWNDSSQDKTLVEVQDGAQVQALIDSIHINEAAPEFHCMCLGAPILEFYRGDRRVVTLSMHHGEAVRWGAVWPGDVWLTESSAESLCRWLAARGAKGALDELHAQKRARRAATRRQRRYEELLPRAVIERLRSARSVDETMSALTEPLAEGATRAALYFRLFGCDSGTWNLYNGLDADLTNRLLPGVPQLDLVNVLTHKPDAAALNGAGRWLFGEGKWQALDKKSQIELLPIVARHALGHPRQVNRRMVLHGLAEVPDEIALPLLRDVLSGAFPIRALPADDADEAGGMTRVWFGDDADRSASDRSVAGLLLAKRGDRASLPAIEKLAATAAGDDKVMLSQAVEMLVRPNP
jgi:hypothetical protein